MNPDDPNTAAELEAVARVLRAAPEGRAAAVRMLLTAGDMMAQRIGEDPGALEYRRRYGLGDYFESYCRALLTIGVSEDEVVEALEVIEAATAAGKRAG